MPNYETYDDIYGKVAKNSPNLTKDKFDTDLQDPQKSYALYNNIKKVNPDGVPSDYKGFVDNLKATKKTEPTTQSEQTQQKVQEPEGLKPILEQVQKGFEDAEYIKKFVGDYVKSNDKNKPSFNPQYINRLDEQADKAFNDMLPDDYKSIQPLVNQYYATTDDNKRKEITKNIQAKIPDWQPMSDAQYKIINSPDTKREEYLKYLVNNASATKQSQDKVQAMIANGAVDPNIVVNPTLESYDENLKNNKEQYNTALTTIENQTKTFAKSALTGVGGYQSPNYFLKTLSNNLLSQIPIYGSTQQPEQQGESQDNKRLADIFSQYGVKPEGEQEKEFDPHSGNVRTALGQGAGFILPLTLSSGVGEASKLIGEGGEAERLMASENMIDRVSGRVLNTAFTNTIPMVASETGTPLHAVMSSMGYAAGDYLLSKVGISATNSVGKSLALKAATELGIGATKGVVGGYLGAVTGDAYNKVKGDVLNDPEFKKTWSEVVDPTDQDKIAQLTAFGIMGVGGGMMEAANHGYIPKISSFVDFMKPTVDRLKEKGIPVKDIQDKAQTFDVNRGKNESVVNESIDAAKQTNHPPATPNVLQHEPVTKAEEAVVSSVKSKDISDISKDKIGDTKVTVSSPSDDKEYKSVQKEVIRKGLKQQVVPVTDAKGNVTNKVVVYDEVHKAMADRTVELIKKEQAGAITPDEVYEMHSIMGQDPKEFLTTLSKKAKKDGNNILFLQYEKLASEVDFATEGNKAYNKVSALIQQNKDATDFDAKKKLADQAEIEARKYGFKIHRTSPTDLTVETNKTNPTTDKPENPKDGFHYDPENIATIKDMVNRYASEAQDEEENDKQKDIKNQIEDYADAEGLRVKADGGRLIVSDYNGKELPMQDGGFKNLSAYPEKENINKVLLAMGRAKGILDIPDMTQEESEKGWYDIQDGKDTKEGEKLLEGLNKMSLADSYPTSKYGNMKLNDLLHISANKEKTGQNLYAQDVRDISSPVSKINDTFIGSNDIAKVESKKKSNTPEAELLKVDFNKGKIFEPKEGEVLNPDEYDKRISEESDNAHDILQAYERQSEANTDKINSDEKKKYIDDAIGKKGVSTDSFKENSDRNFTTQGMAKQYLRSNGKPIDMIAKEASEMFSKGEHDDIISKEDVVNHILGNEYQKKNTSLMTSLKDRFKEITGVDLHPTPFKDFTKFAIQESNRQLQQEYSKYGKEEDLSNEDFWRQSHEDIASQLGAEKQAAEGVKPQEEEAPELQKQLNKEGEKSLADYDIRQLGIGDTKQAAMLADKAKGLLYKNYFQNKYSGKDIKEVTDVPKYMIQSEVDMRNTVFKAAKESLGDPQKFKDKLEDYAIAASGMDGKDKTFTAQRLMELSEVISDKNSMRQAMNYILKRQKFTVNDKDIEAQTIEENKIYAASTIRALRPPSKELKASITRAFNPNKDMEFESLFGKEPTKFHQGIKDGLNLVRKAHWLYNDMPERLKQSTYDLYRKVLQATNRDRAYNISVLKRNLHPSTFNDYSESEKNNVVKAFEKGHFVDRRYYTPEELKTQFNLTDKEAGLYSHLKDETDRYKQWYKESGKAKANYEAMSDEEKKKFDDTHKKYLDAENGYFPFYRQGSHYVMYHGLNELTNQEEPHYSLFESKKEAEDFVENLKTYKIPDVNKTGDLFDHKYVGMTKGQRDETKPPMVGELKKAPPDIISEFAKSPDDIAYLIDKAGIKQGSDAYDRLMAVKKSMEAQAYNPAFMKSNRVAGVPTTWGNALRSMESMGHRAVHNLANNNTERVYSDEAAKTFTAGSHTYRKQWDDWYNNLQTNNDFNGFTSGLTKVLYAQQLLAKPRFVLQQFAHAFQRTYPELGDRLDNIQRRSKELGTQVPSDWALKIWGSKWGGALKYASHMVGKEADQKFKSTEWSDLEHKIMQRGRMSGLLGNINYDQMFGKDGGEAETGSTLNGWGTLHSNLIVRNHAALTALELAKHEGLTANYDELLKDPAKNKAAINKIENNVWNYVSDFVDKSLDVQGKASFSEFERQPKYDSKMMGNLVNTFVRAEMFFKGTHLNYNFWFSDMMQRPGKLMNIARTVAPRLVVGGIKSAPLAFIGAGVTALYQNMTGGSKDPLDKHLRPEMQKYFGKEQGNQYADMLIYGLPAYWNSDMRSMVGLGDIYNVDMPLQDQMYGGASETVGADLKSVADVSNGEYNKAVTDLPGEIHNLGKAYHWLDMNKNWTTAQTQEPRGFNRFFHPNPMQIGARALGFPTTQEAKTQNEFEIKNSFIGDGSPYDFPTGGRKKDIYDNVGDVVLSNYKGEGKKAINDYINNPSDDTFKKAFGDKLLKKVQDYNKDLVGDYYNAVQADNFSTPDMKKTIQEFKSMGIGLNWGDKIWDNNHTEEGKTDTGIRDADFGKQSQLVNYIKSKIKSDIGQ